MLSGSLSRKIASRVRAPRIIARDFARLAEQACRDFVSAYAQFHQDRQTPGRVFRIPGLGYRMWLPIAWGETVAQRRFGLFEPSTFQTLNEIVRPGSVVVEIGACYGEFTVHLSRLVGPAGRVYSFELFPPYFAIARRNVQLNNLTNVHLMNCAVGATESRRVRVDVAATHPYGSLDQISQLDYSLRDNQSNSRSGLVEVETISLRAFIRREGLVPSLIFMDIEGCELQVLQDLQPLLRGADERPTVYLELHRAFYGEEGITWLRHLFDRSGYSTRSIDAHLLCMPTDAPRGPEIEPFSTIIHPEES